jgi:aminopeptidase-like protein
MRGEQAVSRDGRDVEMLPLIERLYPLCRSITGDGVRESLKILQEYIPLKLHEVATGTPAFDWSVPQEWNIRQAYIATMTGERVVDFADHNLHIVHYSPPMDRVVALEELRSHLHTIAERPDWIPYRTSYYAANWGFCVTQRQFDALTDDRYRVVIDSRLSDGSLTYGELTVPGKHDETVLISTHICHPSLANDNLSGVVVATALASRLRARGPRYTYRFLFAPGTIGSLTWLALNEAQLPAVRHGLVLSCLGDAGGLTYKQSRRGDAPIDRIVAHVMRHDRGPSRIVPFTPYGYDERQFCSPGFDLPVGCLMRTEPGGYPEYHSSADNPGLLRGTSLDHSLATLERIIDVIEGDATYRNLSPKGEPQLGRRGLYRAFGGQSAAADGQMALLWVLNLSDAKHSLLDIAERSGLPFAAVRAAADALLGVELLGCGEI